MSFVSNRHETDERTAQRPADRLPPDLAPYETAAYGCSLGFAAEMSKAAEENR